MIDGARQTAFDTLVENLRDRMTKAEVQELDKLGEPTGILRPSKEYDVLQERGIQVIAVTVRSLHFPAPVEDRLVQQWKATVLSRAQNEMRDAERRQIEEKMRGQTIALQEFASASSQLLYDALRSGKALTQSDTLEKLVEGTLKICVRDPELFSHLTNQKENLLAIIDWIGK